MRTETDVFTMSTEFAMNDAREIREEDEGGGGGVLGREILDKKVIFMERSTVGSATNIVDVDEDANDSSTFSE